MSHGEGMTCASKLRSRNESHPAHPNSHAPQHPAPHIPRNVPLVAPGYWHLRILVRSYSCYEMGPDMNIEVIRERVKVERERQRETLDWHENPKTWASPPVPEQELRQREHEIDAGLLPF